MAQINQKEYLKKYLSGKKDKKKKRKKKPPVGDRVNIIDDDIDISHLTSFEEAADLLNTNEDAPQIVGVIDERPMHMRIDDYRKSDLWKPLGAEDDSTNERNIGSPHGPNQSRVKLQIGPSKHASDKSKRSDDYSPPQRNRDGKSPSRRNKREEDESPPRRSGRDEASSPPRKNKRANDYSPPRRDGREEDNSPPKRSRRNSDCSPPRQRDNNRGNYNTPPRKNRKEEANSSPRRSTRNSDSSPPRQSSSRWDNNRGSDNSPPRSSRKEEDNSPPRRSRRNSDSSPPRQRDNRGNDNTPPRKNRKEEANSSPRRSRKNSDSSPPRQSSSRWDNNRGSDNSPPRRSRKEEDNSPPRRSRRNSDSSPPRQSLSRWDNSPPRRVKQELSGKKRPSDDEQPSGSSFKAPEQPRRKLLPGDKKGKYLIPAKRMTKTLDGKTAGLQSAQELVQENAAFRKREDDLFKNMSTELSGANASTIMRDRKTGKVRDLQKEAEERREKEKKEAEDKEKYSRWGRGLKQVEDYEGKLAQDLHEMSKPLARYADDEDLEKYLKEQEREGDPMLAYIRKKKKKKAVESGKPLKPQYEGEFMPNRFGIVPGHRWDGVDRSNGYEKKWFQVQNAKRAEQEEIYKWSTEDM